jgi:hypothetical protein
MRKNITALLQRGNIKPSDRVKLLVADMASRERDGKPLLTEADKHALREGWTPKNNEEVREYNRFNEGWKNVAYAEMDAQTTYLQATNGFLRASKYISYVLFKIKFTEEADIIKRGFYDHATKSLLEKYDIETIRDMLEGEAIKKEMTKDSKGLGLVLGYLGFEPDYLIYYYAYELAGEELQKDLLVLYPEANTERGYLEQEEIIFNLFDGKDKLTPEAKKKLSELIADECFNEYSGYWRFDGYFASIPLLEVLNKWGKDNNAIAKKPGDLTKHLKDGKEYKDEGEEGADLFDAIRKDLTPKLTAYAKENKREIKDIIKETVLKWLNEGLLDKYPPLFKSDKKVTRNGQDTKPTRKELFKKWLEVKAKARGEIQGLIDKGELKTERKTLVMETGQTRPDRTKTIITGQSLYNFKGDYQFIKDFKKQAENFKLFGALVLSLRKCSFVKDYSTLLAFELLFKELSKTFETDLTYSIKKWLESFKSELEQLRREFLMLGDDIRHANYKSDRVYYLSESPIEDLMTMPFDPDKIKPDMDGRIKVYAGKIKDILQDDFKNPFD